MRSMRQRLAAVTLLGGLTTLGIGLAAGPANADVDTNCLGIIGQAQSGSLHLASNPAAGSDAPMPPGVSRMILTAQEDMRREIARQMHDGPAQSLTNIVLQAQIVDRLMTKAPDNAHAEVHQLIAMVQRTLDATKTFIFDVRPMVLDDLGLVPTLRRTASERSRRSGISSPSTSR